ncbi:MAG TPA: cytidine deaminase, partial [Lutibacter sp.]|nr:cytidine deaminase [Lutibacter sp.]
MKKIELKTQITIFDSINELPAVVNELMNKAIEAKQNAYAPYSKFKVGAAFLLEDGTIITGNNQENAAYPSGMCAERVAIW